MKRDLYSLLGQWISHYRGWILGIVLVLSLVPLYLLQGLEMRTDYAELISQEEGYQQDFNQYLKKFGASEALSVVIESPQAFKIADRARDILVDLKDKEGKPLVKRVLYRVDPEFIHRHGLLLASGEEFREFKANTPNLARLAHSRHLADFINSLTASMKRESQKGTEDQKPRTNDFPLEFLKKLDETVKGKEVSPPILEESQDRRAGLFSGLTREGYITLPGPKKNAFMQIYPTTTSDNFKPLKAFMEGVKKAFAKARKDCEVQIAYTGSPKYTVDEMEDSNKDMRVLSLIAIAGVSLIFIFFLGRLVWPLTAIALLGLAILWTFGFASLTFGYLNIISIVFAVVLVGLGVDFAIHFIERYGEILCEEKMSATEASSQAIMRSGIAITTSAITTSAAFFISAFSGFKGSYQLGILAGAGILICLFFMMVALPSALLLWEEFRPSNREEIEKCHDSKIIEVAKKITAYPRTVVTITLFLAALCVFSLFSVPFDSNLLNLQRENSEAVKTEQRLMEKYGISTRFAILLRDKLEVDKLKEEIEKLKKLPSVKGERIESILMLLPQNEKERLKAIEKVAAQVPSGSLPSTASQLPGKRDLLASLSGLQSQCEDFVDQALFAGKGQWAAYLDKIISAAESVKASLKETSYEKIRPLLVKFQKNTLENFRQTYREIRPFLHSEPLQIKEIPRALREHFISSDGQIAIYIYPRINVRKAENLRRFVRELRTVDPRVTGPSIQTYEVLKEMKEGYQEAGVLALIAVYFILLLEFRSFLVSLLVVIPLILGALFMVGMMVLTGLAFNPANLMALPLLFGVGVDNSIHIVHRYCREGEKNVDRILTFTGKAILITSLTTGLGFGSLALATPLNWLTEQMGWGNLMAGHQGLASLGLVMTLGVLACLITSLIFLPALLKWIPFQAGSNEGEGRDETSLSAQTVKKD